MKSTRIIVIMSFAAAFLLCSGTFDQSQALLATHDCSFCHDFHGNPGYSQLLSAENSELVCLSCHTVSINATDAAEVHNPLGLASNQPGYITCRECHDAHDNSGSNIKMVGYKHDAQNWSESFPVPGIRKELPSTVGLTYNVVTYTGPTDFNIAGATVGACEACHVVNHKVGKDCTLCHGHSAGFPSAGTGCLGCHDGTDVDAPVVTYDSPHSKNTIFSKTDPDVFDCVDCHTNHGSGTVEIPNNAAVGIDYSLNGEGGIALGSSSVSGNSEAEICWNCHTTYGVSEWGINTDTNGGANNYDFGSLSGTVAPAWVNIAGTTGATWISGQAQFSYKTGGIRSTHSVNNSAAGAGLDPVATIRCSYCHDVHELNLASDDNTSGKPYLRGSWMGSPYREDGAPQAGDSWSTNGNYGAVPRGGTQAIELGGYQIDQNNGNPTTAGNSAHINPVDPSWELANSAGLCSLCHGFDVDNLNQFGDPANAWVGTNGHANAAIGGSGSVSGNAADIFSMAIRNPSGALLYTGSGTYRGYPRQSYGNAGVFNDNVPSGDNNNSYWSQGFRGQRGFGLQPAASGRFPYAYKAYNWGASVDNTLDDRYHKFSCSKCHNPHASRLPRLLITNCLDTKHNDWDDNQPGVSILGSTTTYAPENRGVTFAMATSAQNCHRLADTANYSNATGNGWNLVSPWTSGGGQDNPGIP